MTIQNRPIPSIRQVQNERSTTQPVKNQNVSINGNPFAKVLQDQLSKKDEVTFSKHASARLTMRQISLTDEQIGRLNQGISKAEEKGIRESLVLMDNIALVVSVENKTVVTAMDHTEAREHVFTNIDGAVVV